MRRWHVAVGLALGHAALFALAGQLGDRFAALLAGTVYLPLWPLASIGVPVWSPAESGGWSAPSLLGWFIVGGFWFALWWFVSALLVRRRR